MEWEMNEDIVISGISGRFPEADNIDELAKNLLENVDMITEDERRWPIGLYGLPGRSGKIRDLSIFDAQFFGVHGKQANLMDPQARLLLELTYEALCDAGVVPYNLRGSRTGVYIGACVSEVEEGLAQDVSKVSGYALTGCSRAMFANRISYTFDFQGPSYAIDTACSSSFLAFQQAVLGLRTGQCDQAIVGGTNICLRPVTALQFYKLNMLSNDGKCKHMDASADGYARAEACSVIFLQKKSDAKRIYATVLHTKSNTDGYKKEGITFPSREAQGTLMKEVLEEANVDPNEVSYIEAHGTGTKIGDPIEVGAITDVYCNNRKEPLLIGSVKSNLGHTEPASGICSIAKLLIAFENKCLPANLHCVNLNPDIPALHNGQVKPILENTMYQGGTAAINCFGFGGVNVHALLRSNNKEFNEDSMKVITEIPRIVAVNGRTESSVNFMLDFIEKNPSKVSREFLRLLDDLAKVPATTGINYRGFILMNKKLNSENSYLKEVVRVPDQKPLWYVFSGMGSQWAGMAKALMPIETFARSIHECAEILKPYDVDLLHLLLEEDETCLENIIAPFVTIAAVQIGLVDILRLCNIEPDGIVGHSVGEIGCAYADGCFDRRQMMLSAYWRGKCVDRYKHHKRGLMAAIGLGWEECKKKCPPEVVTACHNSEDSTTISGPYDIVKKLVADFKAENIFAREVKSCDIAFHSPYIGPIGPDLEKELKDILHPPKLRSEKWISSSVPENKWNEDYCKYSAPSYYVNNLVSPVLFQEALKHVPKNAVCIEIAPHTLLQAILKRSLGADMVYVGFMKRNNNPENLNLFFQTLGKLHNLGYNPEIENLYPKVDYPVPRGTQSVGSLIQWEHSQHWLVTQYPEYFNPSNSSDYIVKVDLNENEDSYFAGHCIDGRILFPATGYLLLAWKMLAKIRGQFHDKIPVEFQNVILQRATILPKTGNIKFVIRMMETNGEFSISEGGAIVAIGKAVMPEEPTLKLAHIIDEVRSKPDEPETITLKASDIYKEFRVRGYDYGPSFQGLLEATDDGKKGTIKWTGNWASFADNLLQMSLLGKKRGLFLPVRFQSVRCDPVILLQQVEKNPIFEAAFDHRINAIVTHGLEFRGVQVNIAPRRQGAYEPILEKYSFIPYHEECALSSSDKSELVEYLQVCSTLASRVLTVEGKNGNEMMGDFKPSKDQLIEDYLNGPPTDYSLLHTLNEVLKDKQGNLDEKISRAVKKHKNELSQDMLVNITSRERMLRPSLDTVLENCSRELKVLEVVTGSSLVTTWVKNYLFINGAHLSYHVAHPDPTKLAELVPSDISQHEWTFGNSNVPSDIANLDLFIYKDTCLLEQNKTASDPQAVLSAANSLIKESGFFLLLLKQKLTNPETLLYGNISIDATKRVNDFVEQCEKHNFSLISLKHDSVCSASMLLRKVKPRKPESQAVLQIDTLNYNWVNDLKKLLKEYSNKPATENIWLVGDESQFSGVLGLTNCLRQEPNGNKIRCIFKTNGGKVDFKKELYANILKNDLVVNILHDNLGSYRHVTMKKMNEDEYITTEHAYLNVLTRGDLSSLKWIEAQHKYHDQMTISQKSSYHLYHVYYAPLNFRDIMLATGKLPPDALPGDLALQDCILGLEFAGRDSNGKRVMGITPSKGLATTIIIKDNDFVWPVPDNWTMEEASTVPVAYVTAYYAIMVRGNLQPGETVLIHSGSGGVGLAAISICLSMGCQVFTTVGTQEKREFLKKQFPQLKDRNIANSRNTNFEQHILKETKGRGADVVLNSLSEEKLHASLHCLAQHGRFLEIGKYDLSQNNPIGMSAFLKNIAFHGVLLDSLFATDTKPSPGLITQKRMVSQLILEGIKTGAVKPLPRTLFSSDEAESAFRFMASGKHTGKVVLKIREEESQSIFHPAPIHFKAIPRTVFHPLKSYIVIGGLGGFGLELASWMVDRGAKNLILTSRSGPKDGYQLMSLKKLKSNGAKVVISKANCSTVEGVKMLVKEAKTLGILGGIFNLALVLEDGLFENQTPEKFDKVCESKVKGTINLDKVTRDMGINLDHFVCFSSISCGRGNAGQTNYGFANSVMERVCEVRRKDGLAGIAIQWGAVGDVGVILEKTGTNETSVGGSIPQRMPSCFSVLDRFLHLPNAVCSSFVKDESKTGFTSTTKGGLVATVANILGVRNPALLHPALSLSELGLDSLMGVEVKQTLEREYDVILSMAEVRALTIKQIKDINEGNITCLRVETQMAEIELSFPVISIPADPSTNLNHINEGKPIFLLPPIEGVFNLVMPLAKLLTRPVIGLNWTRECKHLHSIEEVAKYYISECRILQPQGPLDLAGYSFGCVVAYEMSLQTEVSNLILLDASPSQVKKTIETYRTKTEVNNVDEAQIEALTIFLSQFVPIDYAKTKEELLTIPDKNERYAKASAIYIENGGPTCDADDLQFAVQSFYDKINMLHNYEKFTKISPLKGIILLRCDEPLFKRDEKIPEDYGLSECTDKPVTVKVMKGNHKSFISLNLQEMAMIINERL